jgi:3-oxoacyl-[acyl-carrier protein] reductase
MDLGLSGRAGIVTGASRGIGMATARLLCAEGARVLLAARDGERLSEAVAECRAAGSGANGAQAEGLALDVTAPDAGDRLVADCLDAFGRLDFVVANAGTSAAIPLDELPDEEWERQWGLNVMGPMRLMRAAAPLMAERGWGRIVNVASSAGKRPSLTNVAYAVTKAAQLSLSRAFADAYASRAVRVNAVTPGPVASSLWVADGGLGDQAARLSGKTRDEAIAAQAAKVPLGRFGEPEEIARVVVFLCSEASSNVTGAAWSADGGTFASIV